MAVNFTIGAEDQYSEELDRAKQAFASLGQEVGEISTPANMSNEKIEELAIGMTVGMKGSEAQVTAMQAQLIQLGQAMAAVGQRDMTVLSAAMNDLQQGKTTCSRTLRLQGTVTISTGFSAESFSQLIVQCEP